MRRKIRAILMIAVLLAAMLIPTEISMADAADPVGEYAVDAAEASDGQAAELSEDQPAVATEDEPAQENTPAVIEETAPETEQEMPQEPAEDPDEAIPGEPETESDVADDIGGTEEASSASDCSSEEAEKDAGSVSGYAQVVSGGAVVYDSISDDHVQTECIESGVVYVLESAGGNGEALRIVYLRAADREPATGWVSAKKVRLMDSETEVAAYLEKVAQNGTGVCYSSLAWLEPVVCEDKKEVEMPDAPDDADAVIMSEPEKVSVTADNAEMYITPGTENREVICCCLKGTELLVLDSTEINDELWLRVKTEETEGWLWSELTDYLPEISEAAEETAAEEHAEVGTPGEAPETNDYDAEILVWAAQTGATDEMIERARNAKSLDSLVLENEKLIYVRTGEIMAIYDAGTGILFDAGSALPVARLDLSSGMLYPLDNEG